MYGGIFDYSTFTPFGGTVRYIELDPAFPSMYLPDDDYYQLWTALGGSVFRGNSDFIGDLGSQVLKYKKPCAELFDYLNNTAISRGGQKIKDFGLNFYLSDKD